MYRLTKFKQLALLSIVALLLCYGLGLAIPVPAARGDVIITVNLHGPHVGTDSSTWPTVDGDGGLTDPVVWHFVLNQAGELAGTATLNATFASAGPYSVTSTGSGNNQHFYIGTPTEDVLLSASADVPYPDPGPSEDPNGREPNLILSHIDRNPVADPLGSIKVIKVFEGAPAQDVSITLKQGDTIIGTQTTVSGATIFANLPMGTYEVYEDTILTGFVTAFDPGSTTTLEQGGQEVVITITNTWENGSNERYGRIIINKTWVGANAGAVHFRLYEGDAVIMEGDTAADQLIFEGLMPGEYRIVESTPAGYTSSIGSGVEVVVIPGQDAILAVVNTRNDDGDNPGDGNEPGEPGEPEQPADADEPEQPTTTVVETTPTAVIPTVTELIPETTALGPPAVEVAPEEPAGLPKTGGNGMTTLALTAAMLAGSGITLRRTARR